MPKKRRKEKRPDLYPPEIRTRLTERLIAEDREDLAQILIDCGQPLVMACACCSKTFTIERGCKKRWCPVCAPRISAQRMMRAEGIARRFQWPMAVTLTMENFEHAEGCVAHIKQRFKDFRRTDFWADRVKGGIVGFEITNTGNGFHPHLHALIDCRWLAVSTPEPKRGQSQRAKKALCERAQNELSEVWGAYVQGYKAAVWVNRAYGNSCAECLKYAIKPSDLLEYEGRASDIIDEIDTGRMITPFGHAHATSKDYVGRDLPEEHFTECEGCRGFKTILPADIIDMYQRRPDLAGARFHTLMALAGHREDMSPEAYQHATIPKHVPKGKAPSRLRAEAAKAALPKP